MNNGDIIRYIPTGHPYLIIDRKDFCMLVIDMFDKDRLRSIRTIIKCDYADYVADKELKDKDGLSWSRERPLVWR